MTFYIAGILQSIRNVTYDDRVFERYLTLRLSSEKQVEILDFDFPISDALVIGVNYELVVVASHCSNLKSFPNVEDAAISCLWYGEVENTAWRPRPNAFKVFRPELSDYDKVLLQTKFGHLLMPLAEFRRKARQLPSPGEFWGWNETRFDLYAISNQQSE